MIYIEGAKILGNRGILLDYLTTLNNLISYTRYTKLDLDIRNSNKELYTPSTKFL